MKKKKFNKKLSLNKESIANLNSPEMRKINGGNQQHELIPDTNTTETEAVSCGLACEWSLFTFCSQ